MSNTLDDHDQNQNQNADASNEQFDSPPKSSSGCKNVALGCGCAMGVLLLIFVGLGVWIAMNWKQMASDLAKQVAADAISKSSLPEVDKARILKRINDLADDFKSGKVSTEQMGMVMEQIAQSPLLPLGMVTAADEKYLKPSNLSNEDKDSGRRTLQRLARGAFEKTIPQNDTQEVMNLVMETQPGGGQRLKDHLTDAELNAFLDKAKEKADAAKVPDEPFEVNIADELEKAIDKVLKPQGAINEEAPAMEEKVEEVPAQEPSST